jgi:hypothetical protein
MNEGRGKAEGRKACKKKVKEGSDGSEESEGRKGEKKGGREDRFYIVEKDLLLDIFHIIYSLLICQKQVSI